jgi:hypothetical protein
MSRSDYPNGSELIKCPACGVEVELCYDQYDIVIHQTKCKCSNQRYKDMKPLDMAFKKIREVLNGKE